MLEDERERVDEKKASRGAMMNSRDCVRSCQRGSVDPNVVPYVYGCIDSGEWMFEFCKHRLLRSLRLFS